jgi:serine/threonine-protein kinase HipA
MATATVMALELEVWLSTHRVGTLSLIDGRLRFSYAPDWLSRPDARALSVSLPLQEDPFDDRQARPFFAGLLPEGQSRRLIAQQLHVSRQNDFALLAHIGGECAGAVSVMAPRQGVPGSTQGDDVRWCFAVSTQAQTPHGSDDGGRILRCHRWSTSSLAVSPHPGRFLSSAA